MRRSTREYETALLVEPGRSEPLGRAIATLLGDANLRDRIGEAGRRRVLERFTWRVAALRTVDEYAALSGLQLTTTIQTAA